MDRIAEYIRELQEALNKLPVEKIDQVITILQEARIHGRQIFVIGVGGSAASASQFVFDLCRMPRHSGWPGYKVYALADNTVLSASLVDEEGYENVFVLQMESLISRGDVVIAISPSGQTKNVLKAVDLANRRGATTIGFTNATGGRLAGLVDVCIQAPSQLPEYVEDIHSILQNLITLILREEAQQISASKKVEQLFPKSTPALKPANVSRRLSDIEAVTTLSERSSESLEVFTQISQELAVEMNLREMLRRVLRLTLDRLSASSGTFVVFNENGDAIEAAMAYNGEVGQYGVQEYHDLVERGLAGWVVKNRQAALISNTRDDPRWLPRPWEEKTSGGRSAISVPLIDDDRVVGVITLTSGNVATFNEEDLSLLTAVAMFITVVNYAL